MDTVQQFRMRQRANAIVERGGPRNAKCDLCGDAKATDYHEIVSRGRTVNDDAARAHSFARELCAMLCNPCHLNLAHNPKAATALLAKNCVRYGWLNVRARYDTLESLMASSIHGVPFPPENGFPEEETHGA